MTPDQLTWARRLVEHPAWRWVDGMALWFHDESRKYPGGVSDGRIDTESGIGPYSKFHLPDLSDYATAAIVLRMALDSWGAEDRHPQVFSRKPTGRFGRHQRTQSSATFSYAARDTDLGTAAAKAWLAAHDAACEVVEAYSGACDHGTKGCIVDHSLDGKTPERTAESAAAVDRAMGRFDKARGEE